MPGTIPNTDILRALDQIIAAINDRNTTCPEPVINFSPIINVTCTCGNTGTKLDDGPISATDPPPPGGEPDPNINSRQCKAAHLIYDKIYDLVNRLGQEDVDDYTAAGVVVAGALVGVLLGFAGGPVGIAVGGIAGAAIGLATQLIGGAVEFEEIIAVMSQHHEELICVMATANNTTEARDGFIEILNTGGINNTESMAFMGYFLVNDVMKILFQAVGNSEEEIASKYYNSTCDCDNDPDYATYVGQYYVGGGPTNPVDIENTPEPGTPPYHEVINGPEGVNGSPEDSVSLTVNCIQSTTGREFLIFDFGRLLRLHLVDNPEAGSENITRFKIHATDNLGLRDGQIWLAPDYTRVYQATNFNMADNFNEWVEIPVNLNDTFRYLMLRFERPWQIPGIPQNNIFTVDAVQVERYREEE